MSLPKSITSELGDNFAIFELLIPEELDEFAGHFPNAPILPGIVQINWAVQFASDYLITSQSVAREFQVKFLHPIKPLFPLTLDLRVDRDKGRLFFQYRSGERTMSSGRIVLESLT